MSLQNLSENKLYSLLPEGVISIDEQGLIQSFIGGVQDRLEDLRSYAKKYEVFFDTAGIEQANTVVLVQFSTDYGKIVTRTLDIQDDTPAAEGDDLTAWAASQMDVDVSTINSCVFGQDLLRFVDINTLQLIAANIGAVLYTTAAQSGSEKLNQQRILESYFPRLKIKGTIQSFDSLGRLMGFDDIRIVPLWGRLSPRLPSDFGNPANDPDFAQKPVYAPQQTIGVEYNPYDMRDGPFFTWSGTVVADQASTSSYSQSVNGAQPWVKVEATGTVQHPVAGVYMLSGGGPHVQASAVVGTGLKFVALGEGDSFNGLELKFSDFNDGTDRLMKIVDRLSTIKYRTSYFDVVATVTDDRAIAQFGTQAARKNPDLASTPTLTSDGTASAPFRPWFSGSASVPVISQDYTYQIQEGASTPQPADPRLQATSAQSQYDVTLLQKTAVQLVQAMDEVRPATRLPRKVGVGFLNRDHAGYAPYLVESILGTLSGTDRLFGIADTPVAAPFELEVVINGTILSGEVVNGTLIDFSDGYSIMGTYNLRDNSYVFRNSVSGTGSSGSVTLPTPLAHWLMNEPANNPRIDLVAGYILQDFSGFPAPGISHVAGNLPTQFSTTGLGSADMEAPSMAPPDVTSGYNFIVHFALDSWDANTWFYIVNAAVDTMFGSHDLQVIWQASDNTILVIQDVNTPNAADFSIPFTPVAGQEYVLNAFWDASDEKYGIQINNGPVTKSPVGVPMSGGVAIDTFLDILLIWNTNIGPSTAVARVGDYRIYGTLLTPEQVTFLYTGNAPGGGALTPIFVDWIPASTEVVRSYNGSLVLGAYQFRPEDESGTATFSETVDEYPWRESLVNGGALIEVTAHPAATVLDISMEAVDNAVAVKSHSGVEYNLFALDSTVKPLRMLSAVKDLETYVPGQLPICYSGGFNNLNNVTGTHFLLPGNHSDDFRTFFQPGSHLFHAGLVQGVLVADLPGFFNPSMRDGLVGWLSLNEHPDAGDVANDVSSSQTVQTLSGFTLTGSFADRLWSDERGWYLFVPRTGTLATDGHRDIDDKYSLSFWFKPEPITSHTGTNVVFQHGPVQFAFPDNQNALILSVQNIEGTMFEVAHLPVNSGTFSNVVVGVLGPDVTYGIAPLASTLTLSTVDMGRDFNPFSEAGEAFMVSNGSNRDFSIQDIRMWNVLKSQSDFKRIHDYGKTPTVATYWPTSIKVVGSGDMYGLKATPAGFVYPDKMPPGVRFNRLVRIQRYDSMGRYQGEPRYEEVGLGGGTLVHNALPYRLGQAIPTLPSTGTMVVSTMQGQMPGYNKIWHDYSGTMPPPMVSTNPCQDRVWIKGDTGTLYEVTLISSGTASAVLTGTTVQTAGNQSRLSRAGFDLSVNSGGTVYQTFTGTNSGTTTPLYLYLNSRVENDVPTAWNVWTSNDDSAVFGNKLTPPVAAIDANGILEFETPSLLVPGYYRLSITSGNIGKADENFDGFSVEISVDDFLIVGRLCPNESGSDFRATDVFEFKLEQTIASPWFLSINWLNAYSNAARGVARRLAIFSYKLEKIQTELYEVTLAPTGSAPVVTRLDTSTYSERVPGGWLATFNSYGTVVQWSHESQVYPSNDTVTSIVPLSSLLTSNTPDRREDQITNAGTVVLADGTNPPLPLFSSITVT